MGEGEVAGPRRSRILPSPYLPFSPSCIIIGPTSEHASTPGQPMLVRTRLAAMMFLQYFVWGAWFVTLATYLLTARRADNNRSLSDAFVGDADGTAAVAAIVAPVLV